MVIPISFLLIQVELFTCSESTREGACVYRRIYVFDYVFSQKWDGLIANRFTVNDPLDAPFAFRSPFPQRSCAERS